jgi:hypothetical protein
MNAYETGLGSIEIVSRAEALKAIHGAHGCRGDQGMWRGVFVGMLG